MTIGLKEIKQPQLVPLASVRDYSSDNKENYITLAEQNIWLKCHPGRKVKRPYGGPTAKPMSLLQATTDFPNTNFGMAVSANHDYIVIDVDNIDKNSLASVQTPMDIPKCSLPDCIKQLILEHPTYCETSLSGGGLHLVYKTDKSLLVSEKHQAHNTRFKGSLFISNQFIVFTSVPWPVIEFERTIASISVDTIYKYVLVKRESQLENESSISLSTQKLPKCSSQDIEMFLNAIPIIVNDKVTKAYQSLNIQVVDDYTHWLTVGMALAYYGDVTGSTVEMFKLWDQWSKQDESKYPGADEIYEKFKTFKPKYDGHDVTYATLAKLYHMMWLDWPVPRVVKGQITKYPLNSEVANFEALLNHHNIQLHENEIDQSLQIQGDADIVSKYFSDDYTDSTNLVVDIWRFCQAKGFMGLSYQQAHAFTKLACSMARTYNPVKRWVESKPWDGIDRVDTLLNTLDLFGQDHTLSHTYIKKNLFGVIRAHFYKGPFKASTGVVVLQGPERTYKSTWLRNLMPPQFQKYVGASQVDIRHVPVKEMQLEAAQLQLVIYDEVERVATARSISALKNFLIQESDMYRPLFSNTLAQKPRKSVFWGTTNETSFALGDTGSRRIQLVPVRMADTEAMLRIDKQQLYAQLLDIFRKTPVVDQPKLWVLSEEEVRDTNIRNDIGNVHSNIYDMLFELYMFNKSRSDGVERAVIDQKELQGLLANISRSASSGRLVTLSQVRNLFTVHFGQSVNNSALKASLFKLCGEYTSSLFSSVVTQTRGKNFTITRGSVRPNDRVYYVMPPRVPEETSEDSPKLQ